MLDIEAIIEALTVAAEKSDEEVRPQDRPSPMWIKRFADNLTRHLEDQHE